MVPVVGMGAWLSSSMSDYNADLHMRAGHQIWLPLAHNKPFFAIKYSSLPPPSPSPAWPQALLFVAAMQVVRRGGLRSTLLYNTLGGCDWEVLVMNALIGMGPGGVPVSMSLLQQQELSAVFGGGEEECIHVVQVGGGRGSRRAGRQVGSWLSGWILSTG